MRKPTIKEIEREVEFEEFHWPPIEARLRSILPDKLLPNDDIETVLYAFKEDERRSFVNNQRRIVTLLEF